MKNRMSYLFTSICIFVLVFLMAACTQMPQTVTAANVRTFPITGFQDTAGAEYISISDSGLEVCRIGTFTGTFVEQGTDTDCNDIPAIIVQNTSDRMIKKAVLVQGSQTFVVT